MSESDEHVPIQLRDVARRLKAGEEVVTITVRTLLDWFDSKRRGSQITEWISECLADVGLTTEPDFRGVWIDGEVSLHLVPAEPQPVVNLPNKDDEVPAPSDDPTQPPSVAFDPTYRVGRLFAANQSVEGVAPDVNIAEAITLMLQRDYSQLPVWTSERNVRGMISWKSIASRVAVGQDYSKVRFCMETHRDVSSEASLFDAIPVIVEAGYVLVRGPDQRVVGIVTASDLSLQFRQLAEPFLMLGEIEQHIRKIVGGKISIQDLKSACDPSDSMREVEKVSDLSGSSVESVGGCRFGQFSKCMIQRSFRDVEGPKPVGFSDGHLGLVVQALDDPA